MASNDTSPAALLEGVRILDFSRVLAGPWATQLLADLGAEVIKIERPGTGDDTRGWGPPWLRDAAGKPTAESAYFLSTNRGKRSLTLDLASPDGQRLARELALRSDAVIENFRAGQLAKYGLDAATLRQAKPALVYCSITGFGQTGPDAERAGYDAMIQALGGLMSITGEADGPPQKVGVAAADLMCGMYASSGILAALLRARATGEGETIDLALFDSQLAWLANQAMNYLVAGTAPQRRGSAHPNIVPYQPFACADGFVMLAVGNDRQFRSWCELAGRNDLAADERFGTNALRVQHREQLVPKIEATMASRSRAHWLGACEKAAVPCGAINDIAQAFDEPQAIHRGMRVTLPHADHPAVPQVPCPLHLEDHAVGADRAPPKLGEQTDEILRELGLAPEEIDDLRERSVI
ncbi:MAG: CaiB/BaiF CoA-transferase family protein [Pseudomonadota bacterium]